MTAITITYSFDNYPNTDNFTWDYQTAGISFFLLSYTEANEDYKRQGYYVNKWKYDQGNGNFGYLPLGASTALSANITLWANYVGNTYSLSYELNGATFGSTSFTPAGNVIFGNPYTTPSITAATGYTFNGWISSIAAKDGNIKTISANTQYTWDFVGNCTLTAQWTANKYEVTYYKNDGATSEATSFNSVIYPESFTYYNDTNSPFTRAGYTISRWAEQRNGTGTSYTIGQVVNAGTDPGTWNANTPITVYAIWDANTYQLSFTLNGGTITSSSESYYEAGSVKFNAKYYIPTATRSGYTFNNWTSSIAATDGNIKTISANTLYTWNFAGNCDLIANWNPNIYTIQYDKNGGSGTITSNVVTFGTTTIISIKPNTFTDPTKVFVNWSTDPNANTGTYYSPGFQYDTSNFGILTTSSQTRTLYAKWGHIITYSPNGGTGIVSTVNTESPVQSFPDPNTQFSKIGYSSSGWNISQTATNVLTTPYTLSNNIILYAIWNTAKVLTINYDLNGIRHIAKPSNGTATYNGLFTASKLLLSGYTVAWNTLQNGNGRSFAANGNNGVTWDIDSAYPITLYAIRSDNYNGKIMSIIIDNGGYNYSISTTVTADAPSNGTRAIVSPIISLDGKITGINIVNAGSGYTIAPTLTLSNVGSGSGALFTVIIGNSKTLGLNDLKNRFEDNGANSLLSYYNNAGKATGIPGIPSLPRLTAAVSAGKISNVTIVDASHSYMVDYVPSITISNTAGSGASLQAVLGIGEVSYVSIINGGSGYTGPVLNANYPVHPGTARLTPILANNTIIGVNILFGGYSYILAPTVTASNGSGATFNVTINDGVVTNVVVTNGGTGYTQVTTLTASEPKKTAVLTADVNSFGEIRYVNIIDGGIGYVHPPSIIASIGTGVRFNVEIKDGVISAIYINSDDRGSGYTDATTLKVSHPDTAVIEQTLYYSIHIRYGGANYIEWPKITLYPPLSEYDTLDISEPIIENGALSSYTLIYISYGNSESTPIYQLEVAPPDYVAQFSATVTNGSITDVIIDRKGQGYTSPPTITISDTTGSGAELVTYINGLKSVNIINGGSGYTTPPTLTVKGPPLSLTAFKGF
jgi:uncharacterized repeat protein (TIGR02543 family)